MGPEIDQVAELLAEARQVVALTGAGISVESGIPAFRGAQGLWERYDPEEYATIEAFRADPVKVWRMLLELDELVSGARPNPAHHAFARLERLGAMHLVVTQNVDGLHQAAGSSRVVELHGTAGRLRCLACGQPRPRAGLDPHNLPPRCACGGLLKPDVIFFGEALPQRAFLTAMAGSQSCSVMIVAGTSAVVVPASHLPMVAKQAGATLVEINPEPTVLSSQLADISLRASAGQVLPAIAEALARRQKAAS